MDVFDFSTSVTSWMYRFMKVSAENTCCSSFCKRKLARRLLATQPPCSNKTSSAEKLKMALLSNASGPSLWKKVGVYFCDVDWLHVSFMLNSFHQFRKVFAMLACMPLALAHSHSCLHIHASHIANVCPLALNLCECCVVSVSWLIHSSEPTEDINI